ncbi:MAG: hypothetical protein QHH09_00165 [Microgenomates group bacterium]|nr:hypothetical protein [Microgenomates group bacterium]
MAGRLNLRKEVISMAETENPCQACACAKICPMVQQEQPGIPTAEGPNQRPAQNPVLPAIPQAALGIDSLGMCGPRDCHG